MEITLHKVLSYMKDLDADNVLGISDIYIVSRFNSAMEMWRELKGNNDGEEGLGIPLLINNTGEWTVHTKARRSGVLIRWCVILDSYDLMMKISEFEDEED